MMLRLRLLRRAISHARGASLLVGMLVLVVTGMLVVAPVAFTRMVAREFEQTLAEATPTGRHLIATSLTAPEPGPVRNREESDLDPRLVSRYGALDEQLASVRATFPEPLRSTVGAARWSITTGVDSLGEERPESDPRMAEPLIRLRVDPRAREQAVVVEGTWPPYQPDAEPDTPVGVVVSEESARRLAWPVGEVRGRFLLTGIYRPRDASADYWALNESMLEPFIFDDGNSQTRITATAFADPHRYADAFPEAPGSLEVWFPFDLTGTPGQYIDDVLAQLRGVTAKTFTHPDGGQGGMDLVELTAAGIPPLEAAQGRTDAARAVLTLAATGPVGSALVVLVLAIRALGARRRHALGLLAGRGASRLELRLLLVVDGVLCGVLPAAAAVLAGRRWFGEDLTVTAMAVAGAVGLLPALLLAARSVEPSVRPARADSGVRSRSRHRWAVESLLVGLAAVSVYLLVANGITHDGDVDVLVAAAPVLLAAAACVLVLRLYPLPLGAISRTLARGRSAVGFLGSTRALRDPAVGVAPVLAVLAGVAIAVFSAVVLSTVDRGARDTALVQVGGDLRYDGTFVTDDQLARIRSIDGVAAAARFQQAAPRSVSIPGRSAEQTEVYLADLDQLAQAQAGVPGGFESLDLAGEGVVVSRAMATERATVTDADGPMQVLAVADRIPGVTGLADRWMMADGGSERFGPFVPASVLVALTETADRAAVRAELVEALGGGGALADAAVLESDLRDDSVSSGLRTALFAALAAAGLAAAATVVLTLVVGATARTRMLAILRVLGVSHRQRRWLVVWEQAPIASGALVVGSLLGLGLAVLVHEVVDLSPFAGGGFQPALSLHWGQLVTLVGGFMVVLAVAVGLGLLATRRTSAATAVRLDEE